MFEILNTVTYKSVDKEKNKIIMIFAHAQCKHKQMKILQNRTCWPQVQIRPASKALFYFWYIISCVCSKNVAVFSINVHIYHIYFNFYTSWHLPHFLVFTVLKKHLIYQIRLFVNMDMPLHIAVDLSQNVTLPYK